MLITLRGQRVEAALLVTKTNGWQPRWLSNQFWVIKVLLWCKKFLQHGCLLLDQNKPLKKDFGWTCTDQKLSSLENYRPSDAMTHFLSCSSCTHKKYGKNIFLQYCQVIRLFFRIVVCSSRVSWVNLERDTLILLHDSPTPHSFKLEFAWIHFLACVFVGSFLF